MLFVGEFKALATQILDLYNGLKKKTSMMLYKKKQAASGDTEHLYEAVK